MSPINVGAITDKLFKLNENANFIEDIARRREKELATDPPLYYGLEHLLQISIEIIFDIGSHLLAEEFKKNPKTYQDIILELGEAGVVDKKFAEAQSDMAKFRNKLVHDYDTIDKKKVLEYARAAPEIFRVFGKSFADFVRSK